MNGRRRKIILAVAIVLILGSGGSLLWDYWAQNRSEKIYEELAAETSSGPAVVETEDEPEEEPYVSPINFEELWAINEDVVGWLRDPGHGHRLSDSLTTETTAPTLHRHRGQFQPVRLHYRAAMMTGRFLGAPQCLLRPFHEGQHHVQGHNEIRGTGVSGGASDGVYLSARPGDRAAPYACLFPDSSGIGENPVFQRRGI